MKLLAIYNTFELSKIGNIPFYVDCIRSLLAQRLREDVEMKVCLSAGCPSQMWIIQSQNTFRDAISYNFIEDNVPLSVTVNHSVDKMVERFGEFDAYLYIDSGISFWDPSGRFDALQTLIDVHRSGPYAITAAMPSNDDGRAWLGWDFAQGETEYVFKIPQTCNMHVQLFDKSWKDAYGRILPCTIASHCMESLFSGMAAAIHKKFVITQRVHLLHLHSLDGASLGSRAPDQDRFPMSNVWELGGLLFKTKKDMDQRYREGVELGFHFEGQKEYYKPRMECFDGDGNARDPRLKEFYKTEMFLKPEEFDYASIKNHFRPGQ